MAGLLITDKHRSESDEICQQCCTDKNLAGIPSLSDRKPWAQFERYSDDAMVHVVLPLGTDEGTAECPYGHRHLVVRRDSDAELAFR